MAAPDILEEFYSEVLQLPKEASDWLLALWHTTQVLDDVADGDKIERSDFNIALNQLLVEMPANQFFAQNAPQLLMSVAVFIAKWQASDFLERLDRADERTFMWRAGYYDVILTVVILCHGLHTATKMAPDIMSLYGESYESYKEEFPNG